MAEQRILIVEDDEVVARSLGRLLRHARFDPQICHAASDGLALAEEALPDAAIIDIHLPDLNGLELSRRLRSMFGPHRPIVVLSGDTSMEVVAALRDVGASYFFPKPVRGDDLLSTLRELVGPPLDEVRTAL